jgi:Lon protease-like protein
MLSHGLKIFGTLVFIFFGEHSVSNSNLVEVSLFPIPGNVSMPFSVVPLHVFEPRYTKRQVSPSKESRSDDLVDFLSTNQESYEPYSIFSAGYAQILETLEDGRMVVQINMFSRYEIKEILQDIPYKVAKCMPYTDFDNEQSENNTNFRRVLDLELIALNQNNSPEIKLYLESLEWKSLSDEEYSFLIYSLVLLDANDLQYALEMKSSLERISFLKDKLNQNYLQ